MRSALEDLRPPNRCPGAQPRDLRSSIALRGHRMSPQNTFTRKLAPMDGRGSVVVQPSRRAPRCRLEVTELVSRRRIQQLRQTGARRHDNDPTPPGRDAAADRYDDTSRRMSAARRIRSLDDVTAPCRFHKSAAALKVGPICDIFIYDLS